MAIIKTILFDKTLSPNSFSKRLGSALVILRGADSNSQVTKVNIGLKIIYDKVKAHIITALKIWFLSEGIG